MTQNKQNCVSLNDIIVTGLLDPDTQFKQIQAEFTHTKCLWIKFTGEGQTIVNSWRDALTKVVSCVYEAASDALREKAMTVGFTNFATKADGMNRDPKKNNILEICPGCWVNVKLDAATIVRFIARLLQLINVPIGQFKIGYIKRPANSQKS